jgi:plasmid stability protein
MKNMTGAVDDDVYRRARIAAAQRSTSVSALVRGYLRALTADSDAREDAAAALFAALDQVEDLCAGDRLTREAAPER